MATAQAWCPRSFQQSSQCVVPRCTGGAVRRSSSARMRAVASSRSSCNWAHVREQFDHPRSRSSLRHFSRSNFCRSSCSDSFMSSCPVFVCNDHAQKQGISQLFPLALPIYFQRIRHFPLTNTGVRYRQRTRAPTATSTVHRSFESILSAELSAPIVTMRRRPPTRVHEVICRLRRHASAFAHEHCLRAHAPPGTFVASTFIAHPCVSEAGWGRASNAACNRPIRSSNISSPVGEKIFSREVTKTRRPFRKSKSATVK